MLTKEESQWYRKRSWAEVNLDHLQHNMQEIRRHLKKETKIMAMLKADAYGHGDQVVGPELEKLGADWFGVAELEEALSLRRVGVKAPVLICAIVLPQYAGILGKENITVGVTSLAYAKALNQAAQTQGVKLSVHIEVDTGMNRIGFLLDEGHKQQSLKDIAQVFTLPQLQVTGYYTHFACADEIEPEKRAFQKAQHTLFQESIDYLQHQGHHLGLLHCSNSGATLGDPEYQYHMVRTGIIVHGCLPGPRARKAMDLRPVMSLHSRIYHLKTIPEGSKISYGTKTVTTRETLLATVALGYADGYPRGLWKNAYLLYRGCKGKILGTICMDQMMVDLTDCPQPHWGDEITVVGESEGAVISWDQLAEEVGTINYELLCGVGRRLPRLYTRGGQDVQALSYQQKGQEA